MITVGNFYAHWTKEIEIRRLSDDPQIISSLPVDIYNYSGET